MTEQSLVVFRVGNKHYGVPVSQVQSVEQTVALTPVPGTLPFVRGVFDLRGKVTPLLDMRERLACSTDSEKFVEEGSDEDTNFVLIVDAGGTTTGFLVDEVVDVATMSEAAVEPPPNLVGGLTAEYLQGVIHTERGLLILLNLPKLLVDAEMKQLQKLHQELQKKVSP